jgi:hypothetical protein
MSFHAFADQPDQQQEEQSIQEIVCKSKADAKYEIRLKVENKKLKGVSFAEENWSTKGGPYFDVVQVESEDTPAFIRYNKVGKENAFIYIDPNILNGSTGILVSDDIAYKCVLDDQ